MRVGGGEHGAPPHLNTGKVGQKADTRPRRGGTASTQPQACSFCLKAHALHAEIQRLTRKPVIVLRILPSS